MSKSVKIIPSLLVKTYDDFVCRLKLVENYVQTVQIDVIDGKFAQNRTFASVKRIGQIKTPVKWEVQLMVNNLSYYVQRWLSLKPQRIIIPYEVDPEGIDFLIKKIKAEGVEVGVQIEPETKTTVLKNIIADLDLVLVMTVHSGWSGQKFIKSALNKIKTIKEMNPAVKVSVDGGIDLETIELCQQAGADYFSVNSVIFKETDPVSMIKRLEKKVS